MAGFNAPGDTFAAGGVTFHAGRWVLTYANRSGQIGFAVSATDDPTREWSKVEASPLLRGEQVRRAAVLLPTGDTRTLLYSALHVDDGLDVGDPRRLYRVEYEPGGEDGVP